jgi:alkanesulfonate monooxygenase SsuD/methylene tetrahydromethanopterin reductase-like flavin-dependent oxidoreductase (luciferase family)
VRFALNFPNFMPVTYGGPGMIQRYVGWARAAEQAGWDGFFVWDHLLFVKSQTLHVEDPWILMAAIAAATDRIRIGPMVTPIPRRRPWKLAREVVSLDHLSNGRLILGVGLGTPPEAEYEPYGEPYALPVLAQRLDEGLDVLTGLWRGEPFSYRGQHYQIDDVCFLPRPLQTPRVPIWVAGSWPNKAPMRRAARYDGVFPLKLSDVPNEFGEWTSDDVRELRAYVAEHRTSDAPFDVVIAGWTGDDLAAAAAKLEPFAEAGATWWIEALDWFGDATPDDFVRRIEQGPPRI